jgi:NADPH2:quinone reductase
VVAALGEGVAGLKVGDRVFGLAGWGAMAEEIAVHEGRCVPMPEGMDFEIAAALLMTYATSWYALSDRARLKAGETLLVLGAAGGVGLAAVELGKAAGARVIAAVSSEEKAAIVRDRGADAVVIYPRGPFDKGGVKALSEQFKAACGPNGADVVYDAVGGEYTEAALRAIGWDGRLLVIGFPAGIPSIPLNLTLLKSCSIVGVFWGAFAARDPARNAQLTAELLAMQADGRIRPHVSEVFPLERGGEAISALAERRAIGKVVVRVSD